MNIPCEHKAFFALPIYFGGCFCFDILLHQLFGTYKVRQDTHMLRTRRVVRKGGTKERLGFQRTKADTCRMHLFLLKLRNPTWTNIPVIMRTETETVAYKKCEAAVN